MGKVMSLGSAFTENPYSRKQTRQTEKTTRRRQLTGYHEIGREIIYHVIHDHSCKGSEHVGCSGQCLKHTVGGQGND